MFERVATIGGTSKHYQTNGVKKMSKTIQYQGKNYTTQQVGAFIARFEGSEAELNEFLNVASLQAVYYGNVNWLNQIFNSRTMRLKSGKLNKLGTECVSYVRAHVPCVLWNVKENRIQMKRLKEGNKLIGKLVVPFEKFTDDDTGKELDTLVDAIEHPTFTYTLADYRDIVASMESDTPAASNKKASTLATQLETMAALLNGEKESKVIGTAKELSALVELAERVALAAGAASYAAEAEEVETEQAEASANVSGKAETRADTDREKHANAA